MTETIHGYGDNVSPNGSPTLSSALPLRIPKNKSTGNLLGHNKQVKSADGSRTRFSFDAGTTQEMNSLNKRTARNEYDSSLGGSGLGRIRRIPLSRTPTLIFEDELTPPPLTRVQTLPVSGASSRSGSRSASTTHFLVNGPISPLLEDLNRFPSESLHSFSFARQSEDFLHSRQNLLQKSLDFMRDQKGWGVNPGLAHAEAKVSGDADLQGVMDLLKRANVVPSLDIEATYSRGIGHGPLTGPAHLDGKNVFESSFTQSYDIDEDDISVEDYDEDFRKGSYEDNRFKVGPKPEPSADKLDSPVAPRRTGLKRTYTDVSSLSLQQKLIEALAQPYSDIMPQTSSFGSGAVQPTTNGKTQSSLHSHSSKWTPPAQAVFRTDATSPWTILSANDLACLTFGVTRAEVRSLSILGLIQQDRRQWLEDKLQPPLPIPEVSKPPPVSGSSNGHLSLMSSKGGITARLLSKAPSRIKPLERSQTDNRSGGYNKDSTKIQPPTKSRGVLLCGEILPIQRRDGTLGAASFWVMEKLGGLIWVVEEVTEDVAYLEFDNNRRLVQCHGDVETIWGEDLQVGMRLRSLLPKFPVDCLTNSQYDGLPLIGYYTACTMGGVNVPISCAKVTGKHELRISSLPHIAGVMVLEPETLKITSSNTVFSAALFGYDQPNGMEISRLIPNFDEILEILREEGEDDLVEGLVIPEHSFRRARAILAIRQGTENAANIFLRPSGLPAKHGDGSNIMIDIQLRVVRSETVFPVPEDVIIEEKEEICETKMAVSELVYAVWITYSRQLHSAGMGVLRPDHNTISRPPTPPRQPPPPATLPSPPSDTLRTGEGFQDSQNRDPSPAEPLEHPPPNHHQEPHEKKTIDDFLILEDMGSGAYGQVKLCRYRKSRSSKVVIKYVTKKRILVDTWTRDRRLGTVPLEIHVLDFLRRDGMKHPNIVEMVDFFEDDVNYYIEMLPHGIPGMDLFDYIELRADMQETECRNIFRQVVDAVHHLHVKARVVHRDLKDENVVLDGEGRIKLIDFGSAAYIKNGPFDVFVGTIDYAAPEVLQGKAYRGPEQDVWAMGILLYTIVYKENPFYNIDEILDHPLRVPYLPFSEECIDLIRSMLNRDVEKRLTIEGVKEHKWLEIED